ncbi:hypothetical protein K461DRAFT_279869 [Myriangium duriaei CBS 260.36]|uniref:Apple domain-containing protein n=1 Tax=Myriangium duriaei CBS 260.36 TaxID=1168546 RepID=A0A9P4MFH4_9PEZI|nr:hypothetical protein K461DRAFT_279869 [Myriangium duriaei CBS 260.36]
MGISNVTLNAGFSARAFNATGAGGCCNACFSESNCAASYVDASGHCQLVLHTGASCSASTAVGTFYSDNSALAAGKGFVISNGHCGAWTNGGDRNAKTTATSEPTATSTSTDSTVSPTGTSDEEPQNSDAASAPQTTETPAAQ